MDEKDREDQKSKLQEGQICKRVGRLAAKSTENTHPEDNILTQIAVSMQYKIKDGEVIQLVPPILRSSSSPYLGRRIPPRPGTIYGE